jgi:hypothetical protein
MIHWPFECTITSCGKNERCVFYYNDAEWIYGTRDHKCVVPVEVIIGKMKKAGAEHP